MALNIAPGDEEAEGAADEEEDEGEDELDGARADWGAALPLELPHAASRMRAAPADAAMIRPRPRRWTRS
jgi:hypothetical protein